MKLNLNIKKEHLHKAPYSIQLLYQYMQDGHIPSAQTLQAIKATHPEYFTGLVSTDRKLYRLHHRQDQIDFFIDVLRKKLIAFRKENNYSQAQLANLLYKAQPTVNRWEEGTAVPHLPTIIQLSDFIGVPMD